MTRDLISRHTAIKTLAAHFAKKLMEFGYESYEEADTLEKMYCDGVSDAMNIVDTLPTTDRPKGKWTEKEVVLDEEAKVIEEWQSARCSNCGRYHTAPYHYYFYEDNFCPNCGADMIATERNTNHSRETPTK